MVGLELWFIILFLLPVLNSHGTHSHEYHEEEEEHVFKSEFCEWTKSSKKMICLHDLTIQDIDRNEIHHLEITDFPAVKIPKYFFKDYYNLETLKINAKKLNTLHTGYLDDSKNSIQRIILKHTKIHNLDWIKMPKNLNDSDFESNLKNLKELRIINSEIGRCHGLCADSISFRPFLFKLGKCLFSSCVTKVTQIHKFPAGGRGGHLLVTQNTGISGFENSGQKNRLFSVKF